ncbi:MAG: Gfo/Idh/MocA family oxidoreductase [Oscillospiraceae bacterium]
MKKVTLAIVGAGMRGMIYSDIAFENSDKFEIVAVAEPILARREYIKNKNNLPDEMCFNGYEEFFKAPKLADAVMICTQDNMHYVPTMQAIEKGYDILLEKPIAPTAKECLEIKNAANEKGVKVVVCHVLRYTGFFQKIKSILDSGEIGEIVSIAHNENVGDYHYAHSFARGAWRNTKESSPMILAKSCHDLDILQWMIGSKCKKLSSFGSLKYFCAKNAPKDSPMRCTDGCPHSDSCPYDAVKEYTAGNEWFSETVTKTIKPTQEEVSKALKTSQYGKCVFKCDNDVVDHQVVNMEFEDGVTAAFTMCAFTSDISRTLKIMGTKGELRAAMRDDISISTTNFLTNETTEIDLETAEGHVGHGGGDGGIMQALYKILTGDSENVPVSDINISCANHLLCFASEKSRLSGEVVDLDEFVTEV